MFRIFNKVLIEVDIFCILVVVGVVLFFCVIVVEFGLLRLELLLLEGDIFEMIFLVFLFLELVESVKFEVIGKILFLKDFVLLLLEVKDLGESFGIDVKVVDRLVGVMDDWLVFFVILFMVFICKFRGRFGFEGFWVFFLVLGFNLGEVEMVVNFLLLFDGKVILGFFVFVVKLDFIFGFFLIIFCVKECFLFFV